MGEQRIPEYAISVRQPWAWAIIHAGKDVENRVKRAITMGGMGRPELAIHAASGMTREEYEDARDFMASIGVDCPRPDALVRGAIIGAVRCDGAVKASASRWFFGPWALLLADPVAIDPIACAGQLGAFRWAAAGSECREPLPWMIAWPERARRGASGGDAAKDAGPLLL